MDVFEGLAKSVRYVETGCQKFWYVRTYVTSVLVVFAFEKKLTKYRFYTWTSTITLQV